MFSMREWCILTFFWARLAETLFGFGNELTRPWDLVYIGQLYIGSELAANCIPFLGYIARLFFIMPLHKAWDAGYEEKESL